MTDDEDRPEPLHLFCGHGIEIEYAIVDATSLAVRPLAPELLRAASGGEEWTAGVEDGPVWWSNELVAHVVELKTAEPVASLVGVAADFDREVARANEILAAHGARLMPTGMHPTMKPERDTKLWPHEGSEVYATFDRVFGCRGHGWSNLQSVHLNLPFAGDEELGALHAAIRAVLPLLPALAASTPLVEGKLTGLLDNRLEAYRTNQRKLREATGVVIPEPAYTRADYDAMILRPLYRAAAPLDPEGILQHEWLNSRGAIARFDRDAIEIRLLDAQETPLADLAIAWLVTEVVRLLAEELWVPLDRLQALRTEALADVLVTTIRAGEQARVDHRPLLDALGVRARPTAGDLWRHLREQVSSSSGDADIDAAIEVILERGPLARRILAELGAKPTLPRIKKVYAELCACLAEGRLYGE